MAASTGRILRELSTVQRLREQHAADPALAVRVRALKDYQSRRFARAYADLLDHPRYRSAARFFLEELYGPFEFADRDAQFTRVVPAVVRLFPGELAATLEDLAQLHALSERLDDTMARRIDPAAGLDAAAYVRAWSATGESDARRRQIALTLAIGRALDRHTKKRLLHATLRLMRGPARAAGLGALQRLLERGFDAFARMKGADGFLAAIDAREHAFADALDSPAALTWAQSARAGERPAAAGELEALP